MTDLKQYHDKLMSFTNQTMTTQELINLGITKHFISKLVKKGKLWKFSIYCICLAIFIFIYFR